MDYECHCKIDDLGILIEEGEFPEVCRIRAEYNEICRNCMRIFRTTRITIDICRDNKIAFMEEVSEGASYRIRSIVKERFFSGRIFE